MAKTLIELLLQNQKIPMHMPGHKRNKSAFASIYTENLPYQLDITEIDGLDDLHNPQGILKVNMEKAAKLWGSLASYFLINGSTAGILASIYAALGHNEKILIASNCHKSVFHASEIFNLKTVFVEPEFSVSKGIYQAVSPQTLSQKLAEEKNIKAFVLTSPTYDGYHSDIAALKSVCKKHGVILIVDQAHGSHLGFHPYFAPSAVQQGADIVIQSLHKTLYSLTSTAILHLNSNLIKENTMRRCLNIFQTSSPSYILLASIENCINILASEGEKGYFEHWTNLLKKIDDLSKELKYLQIIERSNSKEIFDRSKIILQWQKNNVFQNSQQLASIFRQKYQIEPEMVEVNRLIFMTGMGECEKNITCLCQAIREIEHSIGLWQEAKNTAVSGISDVSAASNVLESSDGLAVSSGEQGTKHILAGPIIAPPPKIIRYTIYEALHLPEEKIVLNKEAIGRVAKEYVWAYPPGIPLIIPGQVLTEEVLSIIQSYEQNGIECIYTSFSQEHAEKARKIKKLVVLADKAVDI